MQTARVVGKDVVLSMEVTGRVQHRDKDVVHAGAIQRPLRGLRGCSLSMVNDRGRRPDGVLLLLRDVDADHGYSAQ